MSIKHALLALLAETRLRLRAKKRYDAAVGLLWPLQQAQVYNNLRLLQQEGLVELDARVVQASLPDQKRFRLTEASQHELATWTGEPVRTSRKLKDDFYLKLTVLATVVRDPDPWPNCCGGSVTLTCTTCGTRACPDRGRSCVGRGGGKPVGGRDPARRG